MIIWGGTLLEIIMLIQNWARKFKCFFFLGGGGGGGEGVYSSVSPCSHMHMAGFYLLGEAGEKLLPKNAQLLKDYHALFAEQNEYRQLQVANHVNFPYKHS